MRRLIAFLMLFTAGAPVAHAADPIMPLGEVQPGMSCTGLSVIKGTAVSSFGVEIVDILPGGNVTVSGPRILIRVSGPAVDATGIGPGFSGSPIYCNGRNAGAISESVGEYGNKAALATPIEQILGTPVDPPPATRAARKRSASIAAAAKPLAVLTVGGLSPSLGRRVSAAARKAGRTVIQVPTSGGGAGIPPQTLVPGSAAAASYTSGDIVLGSVGTVAYTDGPNVWLFGHSVDAAGPRALFLQDARVFSVINQPLALADATTFKLALPANTLGRVGNDAANATVGKLGQQPPSFPMQVDTLDDDTRAGRSVRVQVANEASLGNPAGDVSPLTIAGSLAVQQAAQAGLGGNLPPRLSGSMCVRMKWRDVKAPVSTCFRYSGGSVFAEEGGTGVIDLMAADFQSIASLIGSFTFRPIQVEDVKVSIHLRRGLRQSFMTSGRATPARPGGTSRVTLRLANAGGGRDTVTTSVRVPSATKPGRRTMTVLGTGPDDPAAASEIVLELFEEGDAEAEEKALAGEPGPRTAAALADQVEGLERFSGVRIRVAGRTAKLLDVPGRRISGRVEIPLSVR